MTVAWRHYERDVRDLVASARTAGTAAGPGRDGTSGHLGDAGDVEGEPGWLPLARPLPAHVRTAAGALPATPALLWDLDALRAHARRLAAVFGRYRVHLNLALKACASPGVVRSLADLGLGCDVASMYELDAARRAGFGEISACGPSFRPAHTPVLEEAGAMVDAGSAHQARVFLADRATRRLGLRLRVPVPAALRSATTRGTDSRFGVVLTARLLAELRGSPSPIRRLRVHTGESTARTLHFRAAFALAAAKLFDQVATINLGGGFLRLARRPGALEEVLRRVAPLLEGAAGPAGTYRFTVEPGGALVLDHAYLVTEVLDVDDHPTRGRVVTVDASAWNCAPWSKTTFHVQDAGHRGYPGGYPGGDPGRAGDATVVGPSLYEHDAFTHRSGEARHRFRLGRCRPGDRLVGTSVGAYAMTNGRSFNGLPLPAEYAVCGGTPVLLHGPRSYVECPAAGPAVPSASPDRGAPTTPNGSE